MLKIDSAKLETRLDDPATAKLWLREKNPWRDLVARWLWHTPKDRAHRNQQMHDLMHLIIGTQSKAGSSSSANDLDIDTSRPIKTWTTPGFKFEVYESPPLSSARCRLRWGLSSSSGRTAAGTTMALEVRTSWI